MEKSTSQRLLTASSGITAISDQGGTALVSLEDVPGQKSLGVCRKSSRVPQVHFERAVNREASVLLDPQRQLLGDSEIAHFSSFHVFLRNSALIPATELSSRLPGDTPSSFILTQYDWNLRFLGGSYEGSRFPRKFGNNIGNQRKSSVRGALDSICFERP